MGVLLQLVGTLVPLADRLHDCNDNLLDEAIAFFVQEICKADGEPYVLDTIHRLVAGLQRHMREELNLVHINLFQKNSTMFSQTQKALEARCRELTRSGIGVVNYATRTWNTWATARNEAVTNR